MNFIELSLVLLVIAVFLLVVFFMFRGQRKRQANMQSYAEAIGLKPIEQTPSSIQDRVTWLHQRRPSQELEIRNLATLERRDYTIFLLDLFDVGRNEVSSLQDELLLLISSQLSLPRFTLFPRIPQTGVLADLANRALEALIDRSGQQVIELRDQRFNQNYLLLGTDQEQIAAFFDRIHLPSSQPDSYAVIEAGGDTFTYGRFPIPPQSESNAPDLQGLLRDAERWYRILRDAGS